MTPRLIILLATVLIAACSGGSDEPAPVVTRTPSPAAADPFAAHVARSGDSLTGSLRDQCRRVLSLSAGSVVEVELLGSRTAPGGEGQLDFRAIARSGESPAAWSGVQTFRSRDGTWETTWAEGPGDGGPDEYRTADLWLGRIPAAGRSGGASPKGAGASPLAGPFGGEVLPKGGQGTSEEQAVGLKDLDRDSPPAYRLMGTADPESGKGPEEKTRWEWIDTLPDLSLRLVPERSESSGRDFALGAIRFPEGRASAAAEAIRTAVSGRLLELRRSGDGRYQVEVVGTGWLNLVLVRDGLAWVDLATGGAVSDLERRSLLEAQLSAARDARGLWASARLAEGAWVRDLAALHRPGCSDSKGSPEPVDDPFQALGSGAPLCERCLSGAGSETSHDR